MWHGHYHTENVVSHCGFLYTIVYNIRAKIETFIPSMAEGKHNTIILPEMMHLDATEIPGNSVYARLLHDIAGRYFVPGDRLVETEIAQQYGVSRTPVREAIRQLEAEGLVTHTPRLGATIRLLQHAEVVELYEMRQVLETAAAGFAVRGASDAELMMLEDLNTALANSASPEQAYRHNQQFHRLLLLSAKNRFLIHSMSALGNALMLLGPTTLDGSVRIQTVVAEHQQIIAALMQRDKQAAETAMYKHIETSHRTRLKNLHHKNHEHDGKFLDY